MLRRNLPEAKIEIDNFLKLNSERLPVEDRVFLEEIIKNFQSIESLNESQFLLSASIEREEKKSVEPLASSAKAFATGLILIHSNIQQIIALIEKKLATRTPNLRDKYAELLRAIQIHLNAVIATNEREKQSSPLATNHTITVEEAAIILKMPQKNVAKLMSRWVEQGRLARIKRGLYVPIKLDVRDLPEDDPWIIAMKIYSPCYIGALSAAEYWGLSVPQAHYQG